jgi:hypothetical protein
MADKLAVALLAAARELLSDFPPGLLARGFARATGVLGVDSHTPALTLVKDMFEAGESRLSRGRAD